MKLLTFTSLFPNRSDPEHGIFVYQRLAHFARRPANSVHVVAPVPWAPPAVSPPRYKRARSIPRREEIGDLTVFHPRYPLVPSISMPLHGLLMFLGSRQVVRSLHAEHHFDLIDAHYVYPDGFAAMLLGRMLTLPVVVSARGTDMNVFPRFHTIRPMIRWTLRHVIGGIGVSTSLRDAMINYSLDSGHATVIGNGIDLRRFAPTPRAEARHRLSIPPEARLCVAIGSLVPVKGLHFLIPAFARLAREISGSLLCIIGEGIERRRLESLAQSLGIGNRVRLLGKLPNEELRWWYSAADVSCLVSSHEGWPNVLLESLACGTPVVATSVSGIPEVITSSALGILVEQNVPSIAAGLSEAFARSWDSEALIAHARSRTWSVVAEELETFLTERLHHASDRSETTRS